MVAAFHGVYFDHDLFPPVARVYAATVQSGVDPSLWRTLLLWATPGAILQIAGGADRQLGVLLGTGLLIVNPAAGWTVLAAITARLLLTKMCGPEVESTLVVFAAGCIAGDALWTFGDSLWRSR
jgi:uncharacterized oligopeptide transporter (OPT) family protein